MSRGLLRIATAGSVDDGKSTLLGRLLHDLGALSTDTLAAVQRASGRRGDNKVNLALVTDGLRAEREQGITIDVAYRFFATEKRSFIVADTPGHEQYTRNMVTGASTADVAVVLVDARSGLLRQSQRHLAIAALLGVPRVIVAVNKFDRVGWDEEVFRAVAKDAHTFAAGLPWPTEIIALPMSALHGDNVLRSSPRLAWFEGPALLPLLEDIDITRFDAVDGAERTARLAVQWVIPPDASVGREARLVAGRLEGDALTVGQAVTVLPDGRTTTIKSIDLHGCSIGAAVAGQAVSVELADDVDAGRGDLIVAHGGSAPVVTDTVEIDVCWMGDRAVQAGDRFAVKHTTRMVRAMVAAMGGRVNITDGLIDPQAKSLETNDIGRLTLRTTAPLTVDPYHRNLSTGRLIIIDEASNATVGAGMIPELLMNNLAPADPMAPAAPAAEGAPAPSPPSAVEAIKAGSDNLRGSLAAELVDGTDHFSADSTQLVKFHGFYQQDDRDVRRARASKQLPLLYSCMVRAAVPGGVLRAEQWTAMDELAVAVAEAAPRGAGRPDPSLRITTRQGIQYHFVAKHDLRRVISGLNEKLVTTLAACGDVARNVMACPAPLAARHGLDLFGFAGPMAAHVRPRTRAYYDLWVDHEHAATVVDPRSEPLSERVPAGRSAPFREPLYGDSYLPRKFKMAFAWPGDNCVDLFSHDLGFVPTFTGSERSPETLEGFVVFAGGGMGQNHSREADTYPRLSSPFGWIPVEGIGPLAEAVMGTFRDHGDRTDRGRARLKYLLDDRGLDWFNGEVRSRLGGTGVALDGVRPVPAWTDDDCHLGWHEQHDGRWFHGIHVDSGRVVDESADGGSGAGGSRVRTALAVLAASGLVEEVRLTARQDVLLTGIDRDRKAEIDEVLDAHGVIRPAAMTPVRRLAVACPALPTCGQALSEAERVLPRIVQDAEAALDQAGLEEGSVRIHVTGCPNGCARPYTAEIGIVGRTKKTYDVYVGGATGGERLGLRLATDVHLDRFRELFAELFGRYGKDRLPAETIGDYCARTGVADLAETVPVPAPRRRPRASA